MSAVVKQCVLPDLLRRFAPTKVEQSVVSEGVRWRVKSNDPELVRVFAATAIEFEDRREGRATLVREDDTAVSDREIVVVDFGSLITANMGEACVVGYDRVQRALIGFFGPSFPNEAITEVLLAVLRPASDLDSHGSAE